MIRNLLILIWLILYSILGFGAQRIDDKITFEQFETLVKVSVNKILDLQVLWKATNQYPQLSKVYFGGGAFRGLLVWLNNELHNKTYKHILSSQIPNVDQLLIQKDTDRVIYAEDHHVD